MKVKSNYHSHVALCNHAEGSVEDHVVQMISLGYKIIGISDHMPASTIGGFPPSFVQTFRMRPEELDGYIADINRCKDKYGADAKILVGLEAEYWSSHLEYLKTLSQKIDYLVFGNHVIVVDGCTKSSFNLHTKAEAIEYGRSSVEALSTGLYSFMAHPDLFLMKYPWDETAEEIAHMIAKASIKYNIPLELNANGIRRGTIDTNEGIRYMYPRKEFWDVIRNYNCEVIINSDAHFLNQHDDNELHKTYKLGNEWGLNIIYSLE